MRRHWTILLGLAVVAAFAVLARTGRPGTPASAGGSASASQNVPASSDGARGLPLGAPRQGPPGHGFLVISHPGKARRYNFPKVDCIRSPNGPNGLLAKASTDPTKPNQVSIQVTTDDSTLTPIQLQIGVTRSWSDGHGSRPPRIRRAANTVNFAATLGSDDHEGPIAVRGSLTCGTITTLG
ncbi:MAG: hypothetical protein J2P17_07660 [Mycobacterium sp.]|nr:hypothetical protein [Mycobacterium sp.]